MTVFLPINLLNIRLGNVFVTIIIIIFYLGYYFLTWNSTKVFIISPLLREGAYGIHKKSLLTLDDLFYVFPADPINKKDVPATRRRVKQVR